MKQYCILFIFQEDLAWAFPKGSEYFEVFNAQLLRLKSNGIMKKIIKKQVLMKS